MTEQHRQQERDAARTKAIDSISHDFAKPINDVVRQRVTKLGALQLGAGQGFDAGFAAARQGDEWCAVADGLPGEAGSYLVRNQQGSVDIGYINNARVKFIDPDGNDFYDTSHWMRIPGFTPPVQVESVTAAGEICSGGEKQIAE